MSSEKIDIGHGVTIQYWRKWQQNGKGPIGGLIETHKTPEGKECEGSITFEGFADPGRPQWHVVSMEPLTLTPSLLCTSCGHHGFITDGKWVPA